MPTTVLAAPRRTTFLGLFLTALSLLVLELTLTRILSVTTHYHFAFIAIALAMFGLAVGAVLVDGWRHSDPDRLLAKAALTFSVTTAGAVALLLGSGLDISGGIATILVTFVVLAVPFTCAGIVIAAALTRYSGSPGRMYAADLIGSALGCVLCIPLIDQLGAPTAVLVCSALAALGSVAFASGGPSTTGLSMTGLKRLGAGVAAVLAVLAIANPSLRVLDVSGSVKGGAGEGTVLEKWNAFSRIVVKQTGTSPFGWGLSRRFEATEPIEQLELTIDGDALTVLTRFDGDRQKLAYLQHDLTALAHHLRGDRSVLVIGVGGGRDVLTALAFDQKRVVGVEVNEDILWLLRERFADFTGRLGEHERVQLVHDEARSHLTRSPERFGIIQASLVDTWAAAASGAYVLTENGLYTLEAWRLFLSRLDGDGILTFSRWFNEREPAESLRMVSLASAALREHGVANPREHLMLIRRAGPEDTGMGVATILVSPQPFRAEDVERIRTLAADMDFVPVLLPDFAEAEGFAALADPARMDAFVRDHPLDVAPPTDDRPFFFNTVRASDFANGAPLLWNFFVIVMLLSAVAILGPLFLRREVRGEQSPLLMLYFAMIGLGFMLVEIGQLSRLSLFLGHPLHSLAVVLFVILLASSAGSFFSGRFGAALWALPLVLIALTVSGPLMQREFGASATWVRVTLSVVTLLPAGFLMGMAFPTGLTRARVRPDAPTAWYWAINGACSVVASVIALGISMFWGITATLLIGLGCYVLALGALALHRRQFSSAGGDREAPGAPNSPGTSERAAA